MESILALVFAAHVASQVVDEGNGFPTHDVVQVTIAQIEYEIATVEKAMTVLDSWQKERNHWILEELYNTWNDWNAIKLTVSADYIRIRRYASKSGFMVVVRTRVSGEFRCMPIDEAIQLAPRNRLPKLPLEWR